uniref:Uncharacterized protein n=1 Tax=Arundo donax TaxID=35708 RepID=A0A0A9FEC9_ARUDO
MYRLVLESATSTC